jgi:myo-inositol-1(or 4)-monophosphatase
LQEYLKEAIAAARKSGELIRRRVGKIKTINYKGAIDLVTDVDQASEQLIKDHLAKKFPRHLFLGEESGGGRKGCAYRWIVDPIDGTTNFAHGFPYFSVSIALEIGCQPAVGVVYDPMHDELFYATKGGGAYLNKKKIRVSKTKDMKKSLLCTGFAYEIKDARDSNVEHFVDFLMTAQAIRRMGSAALDLCYVACGRFDGFWEIGLKPWDTAAAILIVTEAGGKLSRFNGTKYSHYDHEILATNGLLHAQMSKILVRRLKDFHCRVVFDKY